MTEIPREHWRDYLQSLGNRMKNRKVRIVVGKERVVDAMPLVGISMDETRGHSELEITVEGDGGNFEHIVHSPSHVIAELGDDGTIDALDVEDPENTTRVFF